MGLRMGWEISRLAGRSLAASLLAFSISAMAAAPPVDSRETFEQAVQKIQTVFLAEQFVQLEATLEAMVNSPSPFASGESGSSAVYSAFRTMGNSFESAALLSITEDWEKAMPGSPYANFAKARFLYDQGWRARGTNTANFTAQEQFRRFFDSLRQAETTLDKGPEKLRATPLWTELMLAIALDLPKPKYSPQDLFSEGVKRWPRHYSYYRLVATRLTPQWGGSWDIADDFISESARRLKASDGDSVYARLYIELMSRQRLPPTVALTRWPRLKSSFKELIARFPDARHKNLFASFSCFVADQAQFREAMAAMKPGELNPSVWPATASYEGCTGKR